MPIILANFEKIFFQFSFTNRSVIPTTNNILPPETLSDRSARKSRSDGKAVISPISNFYIFLFVEKLFQQKGLRLSESFYQERLDPKDKNLNRTYHVVRFTFDHKGIVDPLGVRGIRDICSRTLWRLRIFENPLGEKQKALSINLEARKPLFLPNGERIVEWEKDLLGNKMGTSPKPLTPFGILKEDNGRLVIKIKEPA